MFGLDTLDVLIGLVTIYLAIAVACTGVVEATSACLGLRAKNLAAALNELFKGDCEDGEPFVKAFYEHPLIRTLSNGDKGRPSYITPELVGRVVESILLDKAGLQDSVREAAPIKHAVAALPDHMSSADGQGQPPNRIKQLLSDLVSEAERSEGVLSERFRMAVSEQFDRTTERASGWFKRRIQAVTLAAATVLVVLNNVDTVAIVKALSSSPEERAELVKLAERRVLMAREQQQAAAEAAGPNATIATGTTIKAAETDALATAARQTQAATEALDKATSSLETTGIPLGWTDQSTPKSGKQWLSKVAGLLVTIFAVMLGAPFWFGVLQQLNAVRSTGKVPSRESPTESTRAPSRERSQ